MPTHTFTQKWMTKSIIFKYWGWEYTQPNGYFTNTLKGDIIKQEIDYINKLSADSTPNTPQPWMGLIVFGIGFLVLIITMVSAASGNHHGSGPPPGVMWGFGICFIGIILAIIFHCIQQSSTNKGREEAIRYIQSLNGKYQTNIIWNTQEREELVFTHYNNGTSVSSYTVYDIVLTFDTSKPIQQNVVPVNHQTVIPIQQTMVPVNPQVPHLPQVQYVGAVNQPTVAQPNPVIMVQPNNYGQNVAQPAGMNGDNGNDIQASVPDDDSDEGNEGDSEPSTNNNQQKGNIYY